MSDIKTVVVSVSFTYNPREYLDYCEKEGIEPTQEDFEDFIKPWFWEDIKYPEDGFTSVERLDWE